MECALQARKERSEEAKQGSTADPECGEGTGPVPGGVELQVCREAGAVLPGENQAEHWVSTHHL